MKGTSLGLNGVAVMVEVVVEILAALAALRRDSLLRCDSYLGILLDLDIVEEIVWMNTWTGIGLESGSSGCRK